MNLNKKTFESVSKRLDTIMGDFESVSTAAETEIEVIDTKMEELARKKEEQSVQSTNSRRVAKNIRKLLEGDL